MIKISDEELLDELKRRFEENKKTVSELHRLNSTLTEVNKKLSDAESMKSHFISNISNEMINPFTSILALSKSILEVEKENWKKVTSLVSLIHTEAFNLDFQFKNIFAAAKIEAGEIYPEISKVNIEGVINEVIDSFKYEAKQKKLTVTFKTKTKAKSFYFKTDPEKLKLILSNLLSNAIKFSNENGKIEIENNFVKDKMIVEVRDYGQGISKENHEIILDRFKKLDTGINSINRGHGLGLSVIKATIDLLEGEFEIDSKLENGATFTFSIPESEAVSEGFTIDGNELLFEEEIS